jgi:hypothetical protein
LASAGDVRGGGSGARSGSGAGSTPTVPTAAAIAAAINQDHANGAGAGGAGAGAGGECSGDDGTAVHVGVHGRKLKQRAQTFKAGGGSNPSSGEPVGFFASLFGGQGARLCALDSVTSPQTPVI